MDEYTMYVLENEKTIKIVNIDDVIYLNESLTNHLNELYLAQLTTVKGRQNAIKKITGCKYNIPHFILPNLLLIKIQTSPTIWVNYFNVKSFSNNLIVFTSRKKIKVKKTKRALNNLFSKTNKSLQEITVFTRS